MKGLKIHDWNVETVPPAPGQDNTVEVSFKISNVEGQQEFVNTFQAGKTILDGGSTNAMDYFMAIMSLYQLLSRCFKKGRAAYLKGEK